MEDICLIDGILEKALKPVDPKEMMETVNKFVEIVSDGSTQIDPKDFYIMNYKLNDWIDSVKMFCVKTSLSKPKNEPNS